MDPVQQPTELGIIIGAGIHESEPLEVTGEATIARLLIGEADSLEVEYWF
jgi:hypothetical protein